MDTEKHDKADKIQGKIRNTKQSLSCLEACESKSNVYLGIESNYRIAFSGDRKTMFIQQAKALLTGDLMQLEKEYESL